MKPTKTGEGFISDWTYQAFNELTAKLVKDELNIEARGEAIKQIEEASQTVEEQFITKLKCSSRAGPSGT